MFLERLGIVVKLKAPENPSNAYQALKTLTKGNFPLKINSLSRIDVLDISTGPTSVRPRES